MANRPERQQGPGPGKQAGTMWAPTTGPKDPTQKGECGASGGKSLISHPHEGWPLSTGKMVILSHRAGGGLDGAG